MRESLHLVLPALACSFLLCPHPATAADDPGCFRADAWENGTLDDVPVGRRGHVAVWTGSEMIVWGGLDGVALAQTGGRYDPSTDSWQPLNAQGAPEIARDAAAVWSGREMIVWGEGVGGRYDPATDTWSPVSSDGAPPGGRGHTAIWTGSEMVIWGGTADPGGRYDPRTDTWRSMSAHNAPESRDGHSAVWTGGEMIIWGGSPSAPGMQQRLSTGGRYDPLADEWRPTSTTGAPDGRSGHAAVWSGGEMLVWGGGTNDPNNRWGTILLTSGGRYDPLRDSWEPTSMVDAPDGRGSETAVWTGSEMIVWGGRKSSRYFDSGGRYDPESDSWRPTSMVGPPEPRILHTAVWTGAEMIIWGGGDDLLFDSGGRYDPDRDAWWPTSRGGAPEPRLWHTAVWTGNEMIIWGGSRPPTPAVRSGSRYDPIADTWTPTTATDAPLLDSGHTAIWSGKEMLVWGEARFGLSGLGGRYDPRADRWTGMSAEDAPPNTSLHTTIWTGREMIVWGGRGWVCESTGAGASCSLETVNAGGRYDPASDTWRPVSTHEAPDPRLWHTAVWTGQEMIVWGGHHQGSELDSGGRYDPASDTWRPVSAHDAPDPRVLHTAVWTGREMIVWGGQDDSSELDSGGRYDPLVDAWRPISTEGAPEGRIEHTAIWTGEEMIVWGGWGGGIRNTGGRYDPVLDEWTPIALLGVPVARTLHTAVSTGKQMIVWGGFVDYYHFTTSAGGRYTFLRGEDEDRDGYDSCRSDCDDSHSEVHPGAFEYCDDLDNDCDGLSDEAAVRIEVVRHEAGGGRWSPATAIPVEGALVRAFDHSARSCARQLCGGLNPHNLQCIVASCVPIEEGVTDDAGELSVELPAGDYALIGLDQEGRLFDGQLPGVECGAPRHKRIQEAVDAKGRYRPNPVR